MPSLGQLSAGSHVDFGGGSTGLGGLLSAMGADGAVSQMEWEPFGNPEGCCFSVHRYSPRLSEFSRIAFVGSFS